MIKLMKHYVTNGQVKARVSYSRFQMVSTGQDCVTLYAKDYTHNLGKIFASVENNSDSHQDYFEKDRVRIFSNSPLWASACERAT